MDQRQNREGLIRFVGNREQRKENENDNTEMEEKIELHCIPNKE